MSEEDAGKVLFPHDENQEQEAATDLPAAHKKRQDSNEGEDAETDISPGRSVLDRDTAGGDMSLHERRTIGPIIEALKSTIGAQRNNGAAVEVLADAEVQAENEKRQDAEQHTDPHKSIDRRMDTAGEDTSPRKRRQLGDLLGGDFGLLGLILKDTKPDIEAVGDRADTGLPTKHKKRQDEDEGKGAQQDTDLDVSVDTGTDIAGEDATVHERRQLGGLIGGLGSLLGGAKSDVDILGATAVDAGLPAMHKKRQDEGEDAEQGTGPGTDIDVGVGVGIGIDPEARI